jgi:hypothetical protein
MNSKKEWAKATAIAKKWYAAKEQAQEVQTMNDSDDDEEFKELILEQWQKASDEEKDDWAVKLEKLKQIQTIMKKKSKYKSPSTDINGNPIEEDEEDGEENTISEKTLDSIIEAFQNGATPDWLILQGTKESKAAARAWVNAQKRIEARRVAAEKAKRKAELREQALGKLSDEEKAALGVK